jgi:hypothetical protein
MLVIATGKPGMVDGVVGEHQTGTANVRTAGGGVIVGKSRRSQRRRSSNPFSTWFGMHSNVKDTNQDAGIGFGQSTHGRMTKRQSTINAHPRLRLEIKHELVDLEVYVQDKVYDTITHILDSLSSSLCHAADTLVQASCGIDVAAFVDQTSLSPASSPSSGNYNTKRRQSRAIGQSTTTSSRAAKDTSPSAALCCAALLQVIDSELTTVYAWLSSTRGVGAAGPMHFKRLLLRVHRQFSARLLQLLLPGVRADNLVGLGHVIKETRLAYAAATATASASTADANGDRDAVPLSHGPTTPSRRRTIIYEAQQQTQAPGTNKLSSPLHSQGGSSSAWWQNGNNRARTLGGDGSQPISHSSATSSAVVGQASLDLCQRLWNHLLVYFDAEGNGLSKSLLLVDPHGPHQVQLVFASLRAGRTATAKRATAVAASLEQMGKQQESTPHGTVESDEAILQRRATVKQLFREWVCCKAVEFSLAKSDGNANASDSSESEADAEMIASLMPSQHTLNVFANLLEVPSGQDVSGWMLAVLGA